MLTHDLPSLVNLMSLFVLAAEEICPPVCPRFDAEAIHLRICDLIVAVVASAVAVTVPLLLAAACIGTVCSAVESACFTGTIVGRRRSTTSFRH